MSKKNTAPTTRHHVVLFDSDWEYLMQKYGPGGHRSQVGISGALRVIIHQRVLGMQAKENGAVDQLRDEQRDTGDGEIKQGDLQ